MAQAQRRRELVSRGWDAEEEGGWGGDARDREKTWKLCLCNFPFFLSLSLSQRGGERVTWTEVPQGKGGRKRKRKNECVVCWAGKER